VTYTEEQFINGLTANDTSETAKVTKRWDYSTAHRHLGDVLVGNQDKCKKTAV